MAEQEVFSLALKNGNPDPTKWPQLTSSIDNQLDLEGSLKLQPGVAITKFSNDAALAGNSALAVPTEQAVKTYVDTQLGSVNTALTTKAFLAGAANQDFTTKSLTVQGNGNVVGSLTVQKDLKVQGNLDVTGTTTFRNIEQHQGDLELGDADTDQLRVHGTVQSTHSSGALQVNSSLVVTASSTTWNGWYEALRFGQSPHSAITHPGGNLLFGLHSDRHFYFADMAEGQYIMTIDANPAGGGNVGIGTTAPDAKLVVQTSSKNAGNNTAAFYAPNIGSNVSHIHWGTTGDWYIRSAAPTGSVFLQDTGGAVSIPTGRLSFGAAVRQMINLWNEDYGIGVQSGTTYFRSGNNYCWFKGGRHNDAGDNPGGGVRLMALNGAGDLILSARTNPSGSPSGSPCRALVDGGRKLIINIDNDYSQGVDIVNGRFVSSRALKQNVVELSTEEATEALNGLNPVRFSYKTDTQGSRHTGFIAEDVPDLLASLDRRSVGPLDVVAVLTKVVQEQQTTIAELAEKVRVLETERP